MENKHLRIIANPYLLKKNIDNIPKQYDDIFYCLSKKYDNISYNDTEKIMLLVDKYMTEKIITTFIDDIINNIINNIINEI